MHFRYIWECKITQALLVELEKMLCRSYINLGLHTFKVWYMLNMPCLVRSTILQNLKNGLVSLMEIN